MNRLTSLTDLLQQKGWPMRLQALVFRSFALSALLAGAAIAQTPAQTGSAFRFQPGQKVYVIAGSPWAQDQTALAPDLQVERRAKEEFKKRRKFPIASSISEADFVFLIILDSHSRDFDELALALRPRDYLARQNDFDALRSLALWQTSQALHRGKEAAIAASTLGYSGFFRHPSVSRRIVKAFHEEVLSDSH